jgi:NAD-dependent SIR2 family protein deacetylase
MRVRCNWCGAEFDEEDIIVDYEQDIEKCPECMNTDYLMDLIPEPPPKIDITLDYPRKVVE